MVPFAMHVNPHPSICLALFPSLCPAFHHLQYFSVLQVVESWPGNKAAHMC